MTERVQRGSLIDAAGLELWSAKRTGSETGLGRRRIYRLHAEAGLPAVVLNGRLWFRPADVAAYFAQHLEEGEAA
jgi:hypothetical protein